MVESKSVVELTRMTRMLMFFWLTPVPVLENIRGVDVEVVPLPVVRHARVRVK